MEIPVTGFRRILAGGLVVLVAAACGEITALGSGGGTSKPPSTAGRLTGSAAREFLRSAAFDAARQGDSSLLKQLLYPPSRHGPGPMTTDGYGVTAYGYAYADAKYNPYLISYVGGQTSYWGDFNGAYVRVHGDFYQGDTFEYADVADKECRPWDPEECGPFAVVTHVRQGSCGASAVASDYHEAWVELNGVRGPTWHVDTYASSAQDPCPCGGSGRPGDSVQSVRAPSGAGIARSDCTGGGGGGGGSGSGGYWVTVSGCWGCDYFDAFGNYLYSEIEGCYQYRYFVGQSMESPPVRPQPAASARGPVAQSPRASVVLVRSLPPGARALILRAPGSPSRNLILLTDSSSPRDLRDALMWLRASRTHDGETIDRNLRIALRPSDPSAPLSPAVGASLHILMFKLSNALPRSLKDVGTVKAIDIPLDSLTVTQ